MSTHYSLRALMIFADTEEILKLGSIGGFGWFSAVKKEGFREALCRRLLLYISLVC